MRRVFWALLAVGCADAPVAPSPEHPRDVVLVSLDSVRGDAIDADTAPALDRLASEGVRCSRAYASSSWTLPSHVTLFTGVPEVAHGVDLDEHLASDELTTLAEELRRAGYRTRGLYSGPYLNPAFGHGRGFEEYRRAYGDLLERAVASGDGERVEEASHGDVSAERVTDEALRELAAAEADERPLFLFVHYFDPHYDYIPPPPFDVRFDPDYAGAITGRDYLSNPAVSVLAEGGDERRRTVTERDLEHLRALYRGEVAWTDRQLGRLLDAVRARDRETLVWVVADHGDEFFEHGGIGHRRTLFEEVMRVPMVVSLPGVLPAGATCDVPISLADVAPTILELVGLPQRGGLAATLHGAESSRGVLGRLVRTTFASVSLPLPNEVLVLDGEEVEVLETWTEARLRVERRTRWPRLPVGAPLGFEAAWRGEVERARTETLRWIDLERYPDEPEDAWSEDFSGSVAREALERFREAYLGALERRRAPRSGARDAVAPELAGLGYVEWNAAPEELLLGAPEPPAR